MFIGKGAKKNLVEQAKKQHDLNNMTSLPFQPESVLPSSLPTAELAVVTLDEGSEDLMVPSKTYYAMAAGSAIIGLCNNNSEVAHIIKHHKCGIMVKPGDTDAFVSSIEVLLNDKEKLEYYRVNSRRAVEQFYSRKNTEQYLTALSAIGIF